MPHIVTWDGWSFQVNIFSSQYCDVLLTAEGVGKGELGYGETTGNN